MDVQDKTRGLTVSEFLDFCGLPENAQKRFELIDGIPAEMPSSTAKCSTYTAWIVGVLLDHVHHHDLGYVTGPNAAYAIGASDLRLPDVGYISKDRAGGLTGVNFPAAPDLAVKVISPSESSHAVLDKVSAYLNAGTQIVWAVYPDDQVIDVHRRAEKGQNVQKFTINDTLDGGEVLPGFSVKVADIFAALK